jgi:hypothetical protein
MVLAPPNYILEKESPGLEQTRILCSFPVGKLMPTQNVSSSFPAPDPRCGFHYFPDTLHYREKDLKAWLPELQALGASWLVIRSELDRAIPENFLCGIKQADIQPIIQFQLSFEGIPVLKDVATLLDVYARWGARYVIFYDRPNARSAWPASAWVQQDLVERFLDRFLPAASLAYSAGMIPVFPPLEPGGSYWDTAFLRSALQAIQRRKQDQLLQGLVLSAYAWTGGHSLDWGAGGPQAWPQARPYLNERADQDQRGFRIFDWYHAIAGTILNQNVPLILLQAGLPGDPQTLPAGSFQPQTADVCKNIAQLLSGETVTDPMVPGKTLSPVPAEVIACNFWTLGADSKSPFSSQAWYTPEGRKKELAKWLQAWRAGRLPAAGQEKTAQAGGGRAIKHYLLLPGFEWGISDWYLEIIRPFVKK